MLGDSKTSVVRADRTKNSATSHEAPISSDGELVAKSVTIDYPSLTGRPFRAVTAVDFTIGSGEFVSIVGPSGCGKTTLLSAVDGLLPLTHGSITIDGEPVRGPGPDRAVVFQDASLLPWRTALRNIEFGLQLQKYPRSKIKRRAMEMLELVGLTQFASKYPRQLSGGMKQRVNLARALATNPRLILLDEPFAALDAQTREHMQEELLSIWAKARKTAMLVTHQIDEAVFLSDRVIVLTGSPGRLAGVISIEIPRPRDLAVKRSTQFVKYEQEIYELLHSGNNDKSGVK